MTHDDWFDRHLQFGWLKDLCDSYREEHDWDADEDPSATAEMLNECMRIYDSLMADLGDPPPTPAREGRSGMNPATKDFLFPLADDVLFIHSPDAGASNCYCSRCDGLIGEDEVPLRVWPAWDGDIKEYRYCESCQTAAGMILHREPVDYWDPTWEGP